MRASAMLHLLDQEDFMKATFGNPKYYNKCASNFGCGVPDGERCQYRLV